MKKSKKTKYFEEKKFKNRGKVRLLAGGAGLAQNQPAQNDPVDDAALKGLNAVPGYGQAFAGLAEVGMGASKSIRGDALSYDKNVIAEAVDPFGWAKDNKNVGDWAKSIFLGPASWMDKAKRKQREASEKRLVANAPSAQALQRAGMAKGGYVLGGGPPAKANPFFPFTRESWSKMGALDSLNRGTMLKGSYSDFNKHFGTTIPQGVNPTDETYQITGSSLATSLQDLVQKKFPSTQFHTITGTPVSHDKMGQNTGGLMNFKKGGRFKKKHATQIDPFLDDGQEGKFAARFGGPVPMNQQKALYTWLLDEPCDEDFNTKGEQRTYLDPDRSAYPDKKRKQSNHSRDFLASGGQLLAKKLDVIAGGELEPVSNDAVEVKANNPSEKDSVELKDAFVDNNEIIDRKNRVFSAELGYASIAKKLEKQKNKDPRFSASNERIEQKLDDLFRHQEDSKVLARRKGEAIKDRMAAGGKYRPTEYERKSSDEVNIGGRVKLKKFDPTVRMKEEDKPKYSYGTELRLRPEDDLRGKYLEGGIVKPEDRFMLMSQNRLKRHDNKLTKASFEEGGEYDSRSINPYGASKLRMKRKPYLDPSSMHVLRTDFKSRVGDTKAINPTGLPSDTETYKVNASDVQTQKAADKKASRQQTLKGLAGVAATYGPNLAAAILQGNLKGPAAPTMEFSKVLDRVRPDAQLAAIDRDALSTMQGIKTNTAQAGDLTSAYGNVLSKKLAAQNQVYGQNQALNADIQAKEAGLNVPIQARNVERTNQYLQNQRDFSNMQQRLTSENIASVGEKFMLGQRQKNIMDLDKFKFGYSQKQFEDSGVGERAYEGLDPDLKAYYNKFKSKGGRMPKGGEDLYGKYLVRNRERDELKKGGTIHIKKENRGKFNALKKRTGKTTEQLKHSKNPLTRKRATFAANAKKWHHNKGGLMC